MRKRLGMKTCETGRGGNQHWKSAPVAVGT
jgi:hypothetical protein